MEGFEKRIVKKFKIAGLFPYQKDALAIIFGGESVFVCQGTGRGKSLCYQAFTTVYFGFFCPES